MPAQKSKWITLWNSCPSQIPTIISNDVKRTSLYVTHQHSWNLKRVCGIYLVISCDMGIILFTECPPVIKRGHGKIHENPPFIGDFPFSAMVISHDYRRHRWFPRPLSTIDLALPRHGAWDSWRLNSGNEQRHIKIKDTSQNWWDSDRKKMNTWLTSETGDFAWTKQDFTEEWRQKNNIPESLGVPLTGYSAGILWMISGRYIYMATLIWLSMKFQWNTNCDRGWFRVWATKMDSFPCTAVAPEPMFDLKV